MLEQRMKVFDSNAGIIQFPTVDYTRIITLPVSGEIYAGPIEHIVDCRELDETKEGWRTFPAGSDSNYMAVKVNGRSMEPNIMQGDIVNSKQNINWDYADGTVCAVRADDVVTLKKVVLDPANSRIILQPFNMEYNIKIIDPDQGLEIYLIGILSLRLRLFNED